MKFHGGSLQGKSIQSDNWTALKKPAIKKWQLLVAPIGLFNLLLFIALWIIFTPATNGLSSVSFPITPIIFALCFIGVLIVHEFVHTLFHPQMGFSRQSLIGFWPAKMLLYSIYNGKVSRIHFIIMLLMPFMIISLIPLMLAISVGYFYIYLAYITVVNAFVSAGDISEIVNVLKQVPANSIIERKGWDYYWKKIMNDEISFRFVKNKTFCYFGNLTGTNWTTHNSEYTVPICCKLVYLSNRYTQC